MSGDNHNQPVRRMSDDEARMFVAPPAQETWTEVSGPNHNQADQARVGFGEADRVVTHLQEIATEAKAGTEHEHHPGWSWPYPLRDLICGCGVVLVYNQPRGEVSS